MSLTNFSCSQQSNSKLSNLPEQTTLWAVLSNMVMTHSYGCLQRQMDPHLKFGSDVENDDAIYTHRGYEKFHNLHYWGLWGEQGSPLKQVWDGLRAQG